MARLLTRVLCRLGFHHKPDLMRPDHWYVERDRVCYFCLDCRKGVIAK